MKLRRLITVLLLFAALYGVAATPAWEEVTTPTVVAERVESDGFDITTRDGYIYITTLRPATVKIFSILGQLISQETVSAGTHRMRLDSRGIYILKVGSITRRITL